MILRCHMGASEVMSTMQTGRKPVIEKNTIGRLRKLISSSNIYIYIYVYTYEQTVTHLVNIWLKSSVSKLRKTDMLSHFGMIGIQYMRAKVLLYGFVIIFWGGGFSVPTCRSDLSGERQVRASGFRCRRRSRWMRRKNREANASVTHGVFSPTPVSRVTAL